MSISLNSTNDTLSSEELNQLQEMRKRCARRILLSTSLSASGHPGGSLSSLDLLLVTYGMIQHDPKQPLWADRDRVVVSIGHISPGVYSVLSEFGYFTEEDFLDHLKAFSVIETDIIEEKEDHGELGPHIHKLRYIFAVKT